MSFGELGRITYVDDIEAVAGGLGTLFGMEFEIAPGTESMDLEARVGRAGIELVEHTGPEPASAAYARVPLSAVIMAVDDLTEANARMHAAGFALVQTVVTGSGFRELFYGNNFHDLPLVIYQRDEADLLHAPVTSEMVIDWEPSGVPAPSGKASTVPVTAKGSEGARLGRLALIVDDLDAVTADLQKVFGLEFAVFDVAYLGLRAALGEGGIELVQPIDPAPVVADHWRGPVAAVCVEVDDLDAMNVRMESAGLTPVKEMSVHGAMRELVYGASFHGIPLAVYDRRGAP